MDLRLSLVPRRNTAVDAPCNLSLIHISTASAKIEVVSAVEQLREGRYGDEITGYLATLTYFYRNPELQMGEYTRFFPLKASAQAWADQFKDRQVVIHVNPRDLTDSVLMDACLLYTSRCV